MPLLSAHTAWLNKEEKRAEEKEKMKSELKTVKSRRGVKRNLHTSQFGLGGRCVHFTSKHMRVQFYVPFNSNNSTTEKYSAA